MTRRREADPAAVDYLQRTVAWVQKLSFYDLVQAIYKQFPEFKANSIFRS